MVHILTHFGQIGLYKVYYAAWATRYNTGCDRRLCGCGADSADDAVPPDQRERAVGRVCPRSVWQTFLRRLHEAARLRRAQRNRVQRSQDNALRPRSHLR